jgi:hypothetical protein
LRRRPPVTSNRGSAPQRFNRTGPILEPWRIKTPAPSRWTEKSWRHRSWRWHRPRRRHGPCRRRLRQPWRRRCIAPWLVSCLVNSWVVEQLRRGKSFHFRGQVRCRIGTGVTHLGQHCYRIVIRHSTPAAATNLRKGYPGRREPRKRRLHLCRSLGNIRSHTRLRHRPWRRRHRLWRIRLPPRHRFTWRRKNCRIRAALWFGHIRQSTLHFFRVLCRFHFLSSFCCQIYPFFSQLVPFLVQSLYRPAASYLRRVTVKHSFSGR